MTMFTVLECFTPNAFMRMTLKSLFITQIIGVMIYGRYMYDSIPNWRNCHYIISTQVYDNNITLFFLFFNKVLGAIDH